MTEASRIAARSDLIAKALLVLALAHPAPALAGPYEDEDLAFRRKDYATAMKHWLPIATAGNPLAQVGVATLYYGGLGVVLDHGLAFEWYSKAAEHGVAQAEYMSGAMYRDGKGVQQDEAKAAVLFRKAAERGVQGAQYSLGLSYLKGSGVPVDYSEAYYWFSLAANARGKANAQLRTTAKYMRDQTAAKLAKEEVAKIQERLALQRSASAR